MRVAIVHYHLQPGGVTRIIEHCLRGLADKPVKVVVLTGRRPPSSFVGAWRVVKGLEYEQYRPSISPASLAMEMRAAAREALGDSPDLWHVHNHSLGKNTVLAGALLSLAKAGEALLLQLHDFAEDGRPANYRLMLRTMAQGRRIALAKLLYPLADHVHYALLNKRDFGFLLDAGGLPGNLHLVPNPVELHADCSHPKAKQREEELFWLYPTRAIRRKNIGELLLWAASAPPHHRFATSLGPDNPLERPRYERWKALSRELGLPVAFEISSSPGTDFVELLRQADIVVTTSVAEGFGLAFLEPWLVGRPVSGRILEEITQEFCEAGVQLPWGYHRLDVPLPWFGRERVIAAARNGLLRSMDAYARVPAPGDLSRVLDAWIANDMVDFGRLDEALQETAIRRVVDRGGEDLPFIPSILSCPEDAQAVITNNCHILQQHYCLREYGNRLYALYLQVAATSSSSVEALDGEILLDHFLAPERLHLLRVD